MVKVMVKMVLTMKAVIILISKKMPKKQMVILISIQKMMMMTGPNFKQKWKKKPSWKQNLKKAT